VKINIISIQYLKQRKLQSIKQRYKATEYKVIKVRLLDYYIYKLKFVVEVTLELQCYGVY